ncbi:MAG: ornithine carbamoyltransferase [Methanobacteriaceae archaeon]
MPKTKDLLSVCDIAEDIEYLLDLADNFKAGKVEKDPLDKKSLAMIFEKSSTRTRVSFEVGMYELGGNALFLSPGDIQMGRGEPIADTAKVLSRFVHGIMIRAVEHDDVVEFAKYSDVPIINGLTNLEHPCQALADMQTIREHKGKEAFNGKFAYFGDGNNVCNSLLLICAILGMDVYVACPKGYEPTSEIIEKAKKIAKEKGSVVAISDDVNTVASGADVLYTDVWVSMGDEEQKEKRIQDLAIYQVTDDIMELANKDAIFMHCLPAIRGQEVSSSVIDSSNSVVIDQAENRLHAQKAILYHYLK